MKDDADGSQWPVDKGAPAIGDPNDRMDQPPTKLFEALKRAEDEQADPAKLLEARNQHLIDIYNALGVEWGGDPFTRINYLRASSTEVETKDAFIEDILAELGLTGVTDEMTIARRIRAMIKQAETGKPAPQLYDSMPLFGYELITRERIRQITQEGWSEKHDDEHTDHSLAVVAALYAVAGIEVPIYDPNGELSDAQKAETTPIVVWKQATEDDAWPDSWSSEYDKREEHPRLRQLAIAGALIAAEIDRLQRAADSYEQHERQSIATELEIDRRNDL